MDSSIAGSFIAAPKFSAAMYDEELAVIDMLLTPSRFGPAPNISEPLDRGPTPTGQPRGLNGLIPAGNLAGLPALSREARGWLRRPLVTLGRSGAA